ncbi:ABC transporter permease [Amycolatopsis sp. YIM 10]|uniref:ABC transporter permease n=1 Tax=Amycolatopsis sp. YIM 10 TaxID=2653857 RepID=UPI0012905B23|nr:ABC transporter permease [Amycolatopsis sp. YIM 10]QFU85983.1 ABC-2 type transporter [Amycolatopsis sp. YIM 10]
MTTTAALPSTLSIGLARGAAELRQFFRQKEFAVFTFSLPAFLLILLGSIFGESLPGSSVTSSQVFAASMVGAGIISTSFVTMGTGVALDREDGTLKRLRGTPMPATSYFIGKLILVAVASVAEVIVMLAVGVLMFDVRLPSDPVDWFTFAWVFTLGVIGCGMLGIALSTVTKGVNDASAATQLVFLGLQFTSGVFVMISQLPSAMTTVSSLFPVKWICQGLRSVFLPDEMAAYEMAGKWELGLTAGVLSAWCVAGLVLCLLTFRWSNRSN